MIPQIDLKRQHEALRAELLDAAARVLDSCRFILGPEGKALEQELADLCGARHGVGSAPAPTPCCSRSRRSGVGPGDEVITSAFSFVASATTIVMAGATPVFVDIEPARTISIRPRWSARSRRGPAPSCRSTSTGRWPPWTASASWPGPAVS